MNEKTKRNATIDLIRVLSMVFVIMTHILERPFMWENSFRSHLLDNTLSSAVPLFFLLSGYLNLSKEFHASSDYLRYYIKRFISILLPFSLYIAFRAVYNAIFIDPIHSPFQLFSNLYSDLLNGPTLMPQLWFMGPMIGMIISVPFLSRMLHAMKRDEITILMIVTAIWSIFSTYLSFNVGITFHYSGWLLSGYLSVFVSGYCCAQLIKPRSTPVWYTAGIVCFLLNIVARQCLLRSLPDPRLSPLYLFSLMIFFHAMVTHLHIPECPAASIIRFIGKHSFTIYLLHWHVMTDCTYRLLPQASADFYVPKVLITIVISLAAAVLVDTLIIFPIQKLAAHLLLHPTNQHSS